MKTKFYKDKRGKWRWRILNWSKGREVGEETEK